MISLTTSLSDHFRAYELADHHYNPYLLPDDPALQDNMQRLVTRVLEPLRVAWGGPLLVVSGYRSPTTNADVGGAAQSRHMLAEAADITPVSWADMQRLRHGLIVEPAVADTMACFKLFVQHWILHDPTESVGGWGPYPGWVHLDIRPRGPGGHIATWIGKGIGSEQ